MWTKVIGFIGDDKYDLIACFARALEEKGFRVLMADYTNLQGLMQTIPDYVEHQVMEYQGIDYISKPEKGEIACLIKEGKYDFILMDHNYICNKMDIFLCQNICFVTDIQRQNLNVLESLKIPEWIEKNLIIKEEFGGFLFEKYLKQLTSNFGIDEKHFFCWHWGERERRNRIRCQYQYEIPWKRTSSPMKKMVRKLIEQWIEENRTCTEPILQMGGSL